MATAWTEFVFDIKWQSNRFELRLPLSSSVLELKRNIELLTDVPIDEQKLIGLAKRTVRNDELLQSLQLKNPQQILLVGTAKQEKTPFLEDVSVRELERQREHELDRIRQEREALERAERQARLQERLENERLEREERQRRREQERREQDEQRRREQEQRRQLMLEDEIAAETDSEASLTMTFEAYSSVVAERPALDLGNKLILPQSALEQSINAKLALPLTFQLKPRGSEVDEQMRTKTGST
jgi:hypothetical protein